jgi:hypothetical protein
VASIELKESPQIERTAAREARLDVLATPAAPLCTYKRDRGGIHLRTPLTQLATAQRRARIRTHVVPLPLDQRTQLGALPKGR